MPRLPFLYCDVSDHYYWISRARPATHSESDSETFCFPVAEKYTLLYNVDCRIVFPNNKSNASYTIQARSAVDCILYES
jgi:hypothetical protein